MRNDRDVTVIETGSGLKWFILGAALGAGLGLLFAPQSGVRTRRDLAVRGRRLRSQAGDKLEDVTSDVRDRGRRFKEKVVAFADEVLDEVSEAEEEVEEEVEEEIPTVRDEMERRLARARAKARAAVGADATDEEEDDDEAE